MTINDALIETLGFDAKTFVEKAIEGGSNLRGSYANKDGLGYPIWEYKDDAVHFRQTVLGFAASPVPAKWSVPIEVYLLDHAAWQAVGKVEGWSESEYCVSFGSQHPTLSSQYAGTAYTLGTWQYQMHRLIDALADGKTIEEYLSTL